MDDYVEQTLSIECWFISRTRQLRVVFRHPKTLTSGRVSNFGKMERFESALFRFVIRESFVMILNEILHSNCRKSVGETWNW